MIARPLPEEVPCRNCGRPILVSLYWKHLAGEWGTCAPPRDYDPTPFNLNAPPAPIPPHARRRRATP